MFKALLCCFDDLSLSHRKSSVLRETHLRKHGGDQGVLRGGGERQQTAALLLQQVAPPFRVAAQNLRTACRFDNTISTIGGGG